MLFIRAMSQLYGGERDTFMVTLRDVVQKFPKDEVSEIASAIVKGLDEGRLLMDDRYDASSIWSRRNRAETDSTAAAPELKTDRYCNFNFVLAYPTGGLDENMLVYEMAHYNFTNFMARNFDIEIQADAGLTMMVIKGFLSYDEVHAYAQKLYAECNGVSSRTRQAAVAWIIFNRLDAGNFGKTLMDVMTAPHQFAKTSEKTPITEDLLELAADVAGRWWAEKNGAEDVGRIIPSDYFFFWGDGKENHFRKGWKDRTYWGWNLESPYED